MKMTKEKDWDLSYLTYLRVEKAALLLQQKFRENKARREKSVEESINNSNEGEDGNNTNNSDKKEEEQDQSHFNEQFFTLFFLTFVELCKTSMSVIPKCIERCCRRCKNSAPDEINAVTETYEGVPISGGESGASGAQGMTSAIASGTQGATSATTAALRGTAIQAAGSAASAASTGLAAAAVSGAAIEGVAAAATTTKIITAVAISAAVVVTVPFVAIPSADIISTCGLENPEFHTGRFSLFFEGFRRELTQRETALIEDLVMESYNNITRGKEYNIYNNGSSTCVDPFLREMQYASMIYQESTSQIISTTSEETATALTLETIFDAAVGCNECPPVQPLFGDLEEQRYLRRRSLSRKVNSNAFFQALIGSVLLGTEYLIDIEELPKGFTKISKALVINSKEEEVLVTTINYIKNEENDDVGDGGNGGTIEFLYEEDGQEKVGTTKITPDGQVQIISSLGLTDFDFYGGTFALSFQGITEPFPKDRESSLGEAIVSAYNSLTIGGCTEGGKGKSPSCRDKYLREMQSASVLEQVFQSDSNGGSSLIMTISSWLTCQGCSRDAPLFGSDKENSDDNSPAITMDTNLMMSFMEEILYTLVELVNESGLSSNYIPSGMNIQTIKDDGTFDDIQVKVNVDIRNVGTGEKLTVGTWTHAPSAIPSVVPSMSPSQLPTKSIQPSAVPSVLPSMVPSRAPSEVPSFIPSVAPSDIPSVIPSESPTTSVSPSMSPSMVPSVSPSMFPSIVPSDLPSDVPSDIPSDIPSDVPSDVPSFVPSDVPTDVPSFVPTDVPSSSSAPSFVPSDVPSDVPSFVPSDVPSSSSAPSFVPSDVPSLSSSPSSSPTCISYRYQVYVDLEHPDYFTLEGTPATITVEIKDSSGSLQPLYSHSTSAPINPGFYTGFSQFFSDCGAGEKATEVQITHPGTNGMYIDYVKLFKHYELGGGSSVVYQWGTEGGCGLCLSNELSDFTEINDPNGCIRYGSTCYPSFTFEVGTDYFD